MDFSWDWVKPGPVMATEPRVKARLGLARTAMTQATLGPAGRSRPVPERVEPGSQQRPRSLGLPA